VQRFKSNEVVASQFRKLYQYLLYLHGEYIHPFDNKHIIASSFDAINASVRTSAGTFTGNNARKVTCSVANERHHIAIKRRKNQFANFTVGERLQRFRIDNFYQVTILPDMHSVLLQAFKCYTGTVHFSHPETIVSLYTKHTLNLPSLLIGVRFRPYNKRLQTTLCRIDPFFLKDLGQTNGVAGNGMQSRCFKVSYEFNLPFAVTSCSRNRQCPQTFGTILKTQSAGKHTIA